MRRIGRGGMGEVWLARDAQLGRRVALKVLRRSSPGHNELLVREARTTAHFSHPHIVQVYGTGLHRGGVWLALELIDGGALRDRLDAGPLAPLEAARLLRGVADALAHAHLAGVVHQDLKPENILLGRDGRPRVADFGLAQRIATPEGGAEAEALDEAGIPQTPTGGAYGTPPYMSPEQFRGEAPSAPSDLWAFGVVLWEVLRGDRPFDGFGADLDALRRGVLGLTAAPSAEDVPPGLGAIIRACLSPDPTERPTAAESRDALDRFLRPTGASEEGPPFRGLSSFNEEGAGAFHGREDEVALLVERLREQPLLALIGPSGTGKSSLVLGGLVPRLREAGPVRLRATRPGRDPFAALAAALHRGPTRSSGLPTGEDQRARTGGDTPTAEALRADPFLLGQTLRALAQRAGRTEILFVDQLEELLAVPDPAIHLAYLRGLILAADDAADPVRVILTLRDDFLGRLALDADIRRALSRVYVVHPPGPAGLRRILEEPIAARGYRWERPQMVAALVEATDGLVASLPLLQVAGALLWERRDPGRRLIPAAALEDIGGLQGALARHADSVLAGTSGAEEDALRRLVLRLVTPHETRAVVLESDLQEAVGPGFAEALASLVAHRLVGVRRSDQGATEVELVHEALISHWARLRRWLDEGRADHRLSADLEEAALRWERQGLRDEGIWTGRRLESVRVARQARRLDLSPRAARFVDASEEAAARTRRNRKRAWGGALALVALLLLTLVGALWERSARVVAQRELVASEQERRAGMERERDAATASLLEMRAGEDRAERRPLHALARSVAGLDLARGAGDPETQDHLWNSLLTADEQSMPAVLLPPDADGARLAYAAAHPESGQLTVALMKTGAQRVVDLETGETLRRGARCPPTKHGGAWSPDGQRFAHQCADGFGVEILDPEGQLLQTLPCRAPTQASPQARGMVAWRGEELYVGTHGGVCVFGGSPLEERRFLELEGPLVRLSVSDRWVAAGVGSAVAGAIGTRVWDRQTGALHLELPQDASYLRHLQVGERFLLRRFHGAPEHLEVWALDGAPRRVLDETSSGTWRGNAAFDAAEQTLFAPWEGRLRRWSTADWTEDPGFSLKLSGRSFPVVSPDGDTVVELGWSGRVRILDARSGVVLFDASLLRTRLRPVGFIDDHRILAWTSAEGAVVLDLSELPRAGILLPPEAKADADADAHADTLRLAGDRAWWTHPDGGIWTASADERQPRRVGQLPPGADARSVATHRDWALYEADGRLVAAAARPDGPSWSRPTVDGLLSGVVAPDGAHVALRTGEGSLVVLDAAGATVLRHQVATPGDVVVDGKNYGVVSPAQTYVVWAPDSGSLIAEHELSGERYRCARAGWTCGRLPTTLRQTQARYSPSGGVLIDRFVESSDETYVLRRLDPQSGGALWTWPADALKSSIGPAAVSEEHVVAVSAAGHLVTLPAGGGDAHITRLDMEQLGTVAFLPGGNHALVLSADRPSNAAWTWDVREKRFVARAERPAEQGRRHLVSESAGVVQHWARIDQRVLLPLPGTPPAAEDAVRTKALGRSNLRVCPDTLEVVPVVPFPTDDTPWAPAARCGRGGG